MRGSGASEVMTTSAGKGEHAEKATPSIFRLPLNPILKEDSETRNWQKSGCRHMHAQTFVCERVSSGYRLSVQF
jgi:hypothetical protein